MTSFSIKKNTLPGVVKKKKIVFCIFQGKPVGAALTLHTRAWSSGEEVDSGGNGMGRGDGGVTRVSEMDSNDNLICLHMKPLFPIFPICLFPWAQCEESDAMLHRILSFQLRPLSLLLSTAAASTANLHSIIFQTELELKSQSAADLKLWTRRGVTLWIFPQPNVNLHILTTPRAKTCV